MDNLFGIDIHTYIHTNTSNQFVYSRKEHKKENVCERALYVCVCCLTTENLVYSLNSMADLQFYYQEEGMWFLLNYGFMNFGSRPRRQDRSRYFLEKNWHICRFLSWYCPSLTPASKLTSDWIESIKKSIRPIPNDYKYRLQNTVSSCIPDTLFLRYSHVFFRVLGSYTTPFIWNGPLTNVKVYFFFVFTNIQ